MATRYSSPTTLTLIRLSGVHQEKNKKICLFLIYSASLMFVAGEKFAWFSFGIVLCCVVLCVLWWCGVVWCVRVFACEKDGFCASVWCWCGCGCLWSAQRTEIMSCPEEEKLACFSLSLRENINLTWTKRAKACMIPSVTRNHHVEGTFFKYVLRSRRHHHQQDRRPSRTLVMLAICWPRPACRRDNAQEFERLRQGGELDATR